MGLVGRPPCAALAPFIERVWSYTADGPFATARERVLPTGQLQLLVNLDEDELRTYDGDGRVVRVGGAALGGVHASAIEIDTAEQRDIVGVSFRPGGSYPFFRAPADAVSDLHVELGEHDMWGADGRQVREQLAEARTADVRLAVLERLLLRRAARPLAVDRAVAFAIDAFERGRPVGEVTGILGFAPGRFIRHFAERVGLTPKRFARLRRFQKVLAAVEARGADLDWCAVALDCGYFDQAHLIRDFSGFAGLSPTAYLERATLPGGRNHVPLPDP